MKYVALLRGINVGGNSKVDMKRLKSSLEEIGLKNVITYINSGNVIFESEKPQTELDKLTESAINKEFNLEVPVVIKSEDELKKIAKIVPDEWTNDTDQKTDVLFLWEEVNDKNVLDDLHLKPEIDNVKYIDGAIIWNVKRKNVTRSSLLKIIGTPLYKKVTIRNINTVRKLNELINAL